MYSRPGPGILTFHLASTGASCRSPFGGYMRDTMHHRVCGLPKHVRAASAVLAFVTLLVPVVLPGQSAQGQTIITFAAPGAGTGSSQGTLAEDINPEGVIAGEYSDAGNVVHGFLGTEDGAFTTFDVSGAGSGPGQGTFVASVEGLTPAGALAGYYTDQSGVNHGYLRAPNGAITKFDVPGAGTGPGEGTFVGGINAEGTAMSFYVDPSNAFHGYVRAPNGTITTFDIPGAGTGPGQGTGPQAINAPGTIIGNYFDVSGASHGFIRAKHGAITVFDVPGAGTGPSQGTIPFCNNPADAITGWEIDASGVSHGFLRTPKAE